MAGFFSRLFGRGKPAAASTTLVPGGTDMAWLASDAYRGTDAQWDSSKPAVELPLYGVPPPTLVRAVSAALQQLEQGQFYSCAYLWDGMMRDDRITATLNTRLAGLLGSRLSLEPGRDTARARKVAESTEKRIAKMLPTHQLEQLMRYALGLSVGVAQILRGGENPSIRVWNPRFLRFDWTLRQYRLVTENRGEITVSGDDPEWVVYEPYGPYGWLHGALIRSLVQPWLIRYWTRNWWSRYQEVHGQPIRAGIIPADRTPKDEKTFIAQLSNLAHEAVIRLPQGQTGNQFDMKLIEATSNNWRGFMELLNHCDDSIAIVLLGQRQSTTGQGGLGTQEKAGESTILRILRRDSLVGDCLREQFLRPWCADEYGDDSLAPYLKWEIEPPEDEHKKAQALLTIAQAVQTFSLAPQYARHVDVRALLEECGLPLRAEDEVPPDVPGTPDPAPSEEDENGKAPEGSDAEAGSGNDTRDGDTADDDAE